MKPYSYYEYYNFNGADFFTLVLLPCEEGKFPVVVLRSPYVGYAVEKTEEELIESFKNEYLSWAENNYAVVFQHCRGQGKSTGDFVPYIHEREDGLALREWIRRQNFYNGQIFLLGGSYTASLHYCTAPFEEDIKGAVFNVQDSERYRLWYRNGNMRRGHANWYFDLYKQKSGLKKTHTMESFSELPIKNLSQRVIGEKAEDFEQMLSSPHFSDRFWQTRFGGIEARDAVSDANIPILMTTGYNDYYVGGMFKMWDELKEQTKEKSALIVSPYNHGDSYYSENGMSFLNAHIREQFGSDYDIKWFNSIIRNEEPYIKTGKVTYYRTFENVWETDFYSGDVEELTVGIGAGEKTIVYNPEDPPGFDSEGVFMDIPGKRDDVISVYTDSFISDVFVKGKMRMKLTVSSDCQDTSFYAMIGIHTEKGDYALRHDITSVLYQKEKYIQNDKTTLEFVFDEYAFAVKKGQSLRIDIAPTDKNTYVCHTNMKGSYSDIETSKKANNKVYLQESFLFLPIEK